MGAALFRVRGGARLEPRAVDGRTRSPSCGHVEFEMPVPAVIVLVHDGEGHVVVTRQPAWTQGAHGSVAGFVEQGEDRRRHRAPRGSRGDRFAGAIEQFLGTHPFRGRLMIAYVVRARGEIGQGAELAEARRVLLSPNPCLPHSLAAVLVERFAGRS